MSKLAFERVVDALRAQGGSVVERGDAAQAQCPGHDDGRASLSVGKRSDGKGATLHCHAGCDYRDVLAGAGLQPRDLFDDAGLRGAFAPTATYVYADGRRVHRKPDKSFPQSGNTKGTALFNVENLGDACLVFVVEGEKDVLAVTAAGGVAVSSAMGAGKAHRADWTPLHGRDVIVVADRDAPGRKHAEAVRDILGGKARSVRIVEAKSGKDAADHIAAGFALTEFADVADVADSQGRVDGPRLSRDSHDSQGYREDSGGARESNHPGTEQHARPVDGAELLDAVERWYHRFICVTDRLDLALLTLWTVHTHLSLDLYSTPRLQIDSVLPESGKTTCLDHMSRLCFRPIQIASPPSPALIPRLLATEVRTILLDEVDRVLRPDGPATPDLLSIINSGYRCGATRPVLVPVKGGGWEAEEMPTYAPVVLCGNAPMLPDDTASRVIRVLLMPDYDNSTEESDWETIEADAQELNARIAAFADQVRDQVRGLAVELESRCVRRSREKWKPLKRVAVAAGGRWPALADALIARHLDEEQADRESGLRNLPPGMVALTDLFQVWPDHDELVPTGDLVALLIKHNPDYWGPSSTYGKALSVTRLGKLLAQSTKASSRRDGNRGPRGYSRGQLAPTWKRLRIDSPPSCNPEPPPNRPGSLGEAGYPGSKPAPDSQDSQDSQGYQDDPGVPGATSAICKFCGADLPGHMRSQLLRGFCYRPTCVERGRGETVQQTNGVVQ